MKKPKNEASGKVSNDGYDLDGAGATPSASGRSKGGSRTTSNTRQTKFSGTNSPTRMPAL